MKAIIESINSVIFDALQKWTNFKVSCWKEILFLGEERVCVNGRRGGRAPRSLNTIYSSD